MKRVFISLIFTLVVMLTGCGGTGGDANGNTPPPTGTVSTNVTTFETNNNSFHALLNITATEVANSTQIELNNFRLDTTNDCRLLDYTFNGMSDITLNFRNRGETQVIAIDGNFECSSSNPILDTKDIQLHYDKWILNKNGSKRRGPFGEVVNLAQPNLNGDNKQSNITPQYNLYPDDKIVVDNTDTTYTIKVMVSITDENGTHPAVGTKVDASFIQPKFGSLQDYSAITDSSGKAEFTYIPPESIDNNLSGTAIPFYIDGMNDNVKYTKIIFQRYSKKKYNLYPDKKLIVKEPLKEYTIKVALSVIDGDKKYPAVDKTIKADFIEPIFGTLKEYEATTDTSGIASFTYTSPENIQNLSNTKINFYLDSDKSNSVQTEISFMKEKEEKYILYPTQSVVVDSASKEYNIEVAVSIVDGNKRYPAKEVSVDAEFIQPMFGKLSSYSEYTDESGIAHFTYISPAHILNLSDSEISFYLKNDPNNIAKTKLIFKPKGEDVATKLYIIPQIIQVSQVKEKKTIKVITVNSQNLGRSATVEFEQLSNGDGNDYGTLSKTEVLTDDSGVGEVEYISPDTISNQPSRTIKVTLKDRPIFQELTFKFLSPEEGVKTYEIKVDVPSKLSIEQNSSFAVTIQEKGNQNKLIDDENVKSVNIDISHYQDMIRFTKPLDPNQPYKYEYSKEASKTIAITTQKIAGVAILEVNAVVFNGKKDVNLSTSVPLIIMSGPISAISLNYIKTISDKDSGFFYDIYNIHAVDKYANPANPGEKFIPTLICGGNNVEKNSTKPATIAPPYIPGEGSAKIERDSYDSTLFSDNLNKKFYNVDPARDRLIILPSVYASNKDYIGGWTIDQYADNNNSTLYLEEKYYGKPTSGLRYVIGDEDRLINDEVHVAHVVANDGSSNYQIDENGTAQIRVVYDPAFVGHTYSLAVTSYNESERTGTAIKANFRGAKYSSEEKTFTINNGEVNEIKFPIWIETPTGATAHLDGVKLRASSFTINPKECKILNDYAVEVHNGLADLNITANKTADSNTTDCSISWINDNSGIYYEY